MVQAAWTLILLNRIAFSGSMNESINAFVANYETIDVFKSWTGDLDRVIKKRFGI